MAVVLEDTSHIPEPSACSCGRPPPLVLFKSRLTTSGTKTFETGLSVYRRRAQRFSTSIGAMPSSSGRSKPRTWA